MSNQIHADSSYREIVEALAGQGVFTDGEVFRIETPTKEALLHSPSATVDPDQAGARELFNVASTLEKFCSVYHEDSENFEFGEAGEAAFNICLGKSVALAT